MKRWVACPCQYWPPLPVPTYAGRPTGSSELYWISGSFDKSCFRQSLMDRLQVCRNGCTGEPPHRTHSRISKTILSALQCGQYAMTARIVVPNIKQVIQTAKPKVRKLDTNTYLNYAETLGMERLHTCLKSIRPSPSIRNQQRQALRFPKKLVCGPPGAMWASRGNVGLPRQALAAGHHPVREVAAYNCHRPPVLRRQPRNNAGTAFRTITLT